MEKEHIRTRRRKGAVEVRKHDFTVNPISISVHFPISVDLLWGRS